MSARKKAAREGHWGKLRDWAFARIIGDREAKGSAALEVYCFMILHADREGLFWWSRDRIAQELVTSPATIKRARAHLRRLGLIEQLGKRGKADLYRLQGSLATPVDSVEGSRVSSHDGSPMTPVDGSFVTPEVEEGEVEEGEVEEGEEESASRARTREAGLIEQVERTIGRSLSVEQRQRAREAIRKNPAGVLRCAEEAAARGDYPPALFDHLLTSGDHRGDVRRSRKAARREFAAWLRDLERDTEAAEQPFGAFGWPMRAAKEQAGGRPALPARAEVDPPCPPECEPSAQETAQPPPRALLRPADPESEPDPPPPEPLDLAGIANPRLRALTARAHAASVERSAVAK